MGIVYTMPEAKQCCKAGFLPSFTQARFFISSQICFPCSALFYIFSFQMQNKFYNWCFIALQIQFKKKS